MSSELVPMSEIERMAAAVAKSGLFGMKSTDQALALMLISQAEGRHPALAARDYDIIQGRPSKKTEAMLRDFLAAGGKVEWHVLDDAQADATFSHSAGGSVRIAWNMARAAQAGLGGKDMWKKYPRQMLRSRCVSEGIRTVYPAATSGMYVPEEAADIAAPEPRSTQVRNALEKMDPATGEVIEGKAEVIEGEPPVEKDPHAIVECLEHAADSAELDEAAEWAKDIKDAEWKLKARKAYKARKMELAVLGGASA